MTRDCHVIVFAKAPLAGFAKTRVARGIGDQAAASLAARMLDETVGQAVAAGLGSVEICCAPDCSHARFAALQARHGVALGAQGEGDLGARMARAFARALALHARVVLIGTDAPALTAPVLREAAAALRDRPAVFAPAHDGGYVLVGLNRPMPELFHTMAWSTPQVMAQSRARLTVLGVRWTELATLHDVDEVVDLVHVPPAWLSP